MLIVTLVYVIFNIPALLFSVFLVYNYSKAMIICDKFFTHFLAAISFIQAIIVSEDVEVWNWDINYLSGELHKSVQFASELIDVEEELGRYTGMFGAATFILLPVLNSCLNPFIFFWRLKPFRDFVKNRFKHP